MYWTAFCSTGQLFPDLLRLDVLLGVGVGPLTGWMCPSCLKSNDITELKGDSVHKYNVEAAVDHEADNGIDA